MKLGGAIYRVEELAAMEGPAKAPGAPSTKRFEWTLGDEALQDLVDILPLTDTTPREEWIEVMHGIMGAGGPFEIFDSYSARSKHYDAAGAQDRWDTTVRANVRSGGGLLRRMAEEADPDAFAAWRQKWEAASVFGDIPQFMDTAAFRLIDPKTFPRRPWLYGGRLMRGYVSATVAPGGMGKSALVMTEILAMVTGRELLGVKVRAPLRVWLWNGEDDLIELGRRIHALGLHYGINDADLGDRLYVDSGREKQIVMAAAGKAGAVLNGGVIEAIKAVIKARRIDVLVLDPFVSAHMVSENDNMAIDLVAKALARIADECHCAVDIVHHTRKPGTGVKSDASVDDARGASALINATRHARVLAPMPPPVALRFGISNPRAYFAVQHEATKANMVPPGAGADWYKHESVGLGNGDDAPADGLAALPEDGVGVVVRWAPPSTDFASEPHRVRAAQDEIAKGTFRKSSKAVDWVGTVIAGALGLDLGAAGVKRLVEDVVNDWAKKGWLTVVEGFDLNRHKREFIEVGTRPEDTVFGTDWDTASVASVD